MTIKGAPAVGLGGLIDVASNGRNDGRTKGDVGNKVAVPIQSV
jgi:ABC-type transporter lipoprotein component MlaA